jgi:hypothetical protein
LVNVVEKWEVFKDYAEVRKLGFYQILESSKKIEIRISISEVGFKKTFENAQDPLFKEILGFCEGKEFIKVNESIRNEYFFQ